MTYEQFFYFMKGYLASVPSDFEHDKSLLNAIERVEENYVERVFIPSILNPDPPTLINKINVADTFHFNPGLRVGPEACSHTAPNSSNQCDKCGAYIVRVTY